MIHLDTTFLVDLLREAATLQKSGQSIATMDLLIATSALADGAPLVTRNLKHFTRVPGLEVLSY